MDALLRVLSLIGRYGAPGFAASIVIGLALPQFAAAARPLLVVSIFVFVMLTFARADADAVRRLLKAPRKLVIATVWLVVAPATVITLILSVIGRGNLDPGLVLGLAVMGAAPPIMSAPAVAMMLGLEPTLLLSAVLLTTLAAPLVAPMMVDIIAGAAVPLDIGVLIQRMALIVGGATLGAFLLRRWLGMETIRARTEAFDGIGVLMYFIFAIAAMDGVMDAAVAQPRQVALFLGFAFGMAALGFASAWFVLRPLEDAERFVIGYVTLQRNMGLLIAALGAAAPKTTFLFFALAQFPIYLSPMLVQRLAKRFRPDTATTNLAPKTTPD